MDETLVYGDPPGPVTHEQLLKLKMDGHILGICGNYGAVFRKVGGWHSLFSFWNYGWTKQEVLTAIKASMTAAGVAHEIEAWIMVGNEVDRAPAEAAGWTFVYEKDFREGL